MVEKLKKLDRRNEVNKRRTPSPQSESKDVLKYLNTTYNNYLKLAKDNNGGEKVKVYKSLDSSSQWKTKHSSANSMKNGGHINILFEINKSVSHYREKEREKGREREKLKESKNQA